jgi:hypothetical protein
VTNQTQVIKRGVKHIRLKSVKTMKSTNERNMKDKTWAETMSYPSGMMKWIYKLFDRIIYDKTRSTQNSNCVAKLVTLSILSRGGLVELGLIVGNLFCFITAFVSNTLDAIAN